MAKKSNTGKNRQRTRGLLAFMVISLGITSLGLTGCTDGFAEASSKHPEVIKSDDIDRWEEQKHVTAEEKEKQQQELLEQVDKQLKQLEKITLMVGKKQVLAKNKEEELDKVLAAETIKKWTRQRPENMLDSDEISNWQEQREAQEKEVREKDTGENSATQKEEMAIVDGSYFADALFIGDSRMQGFMLYSGIEATGYTESGLGVSTVMTKPFVKHNGGRLTVPQALAMSSYSKIYICFGMNELGWPNTDKFVQQYGAVIDQIRTLQPNAVITIEALLPVTEAKHNQGSNVNNDRIVLFNQLVKKLAEDKGVRFIDLSPAVCDERGFLKAEATTDGVHLNKQYCELLYEYMLKVH